MSEILNKLEAYIAAGNTFPETPDGKVNVAALVAALQLRAADAQYFFRDEGVKEAVNALARTQGLHPIGHRASQARADAAVAAQIGRTAAQAKQDAQGSIEARHAYAALVEEHAATLMENAGLKEDLETARRRLAVFEALIPYERLVAEAAIP